MGPGLRLGLGGRVRVQIRARARVRSDPTLTPCSSYHEGGLATAGRPHERHERLRGYYAAHAVEDGSLVLRLEPQPDVLERDARRRDEILRPVRAAAKLGCEILIDVVLVRARREAVTFGGDVEWRRA